MLNASGYSIITEPGKRANEHDTFTCAHCGFITFTKAGLNGPLQVCLIRNDGSVAMVDAGFCRTCHAHICPGCVAKRECTPRMKQIEEQEKAARRIIVL